METPHQQALPLKFPTKNICTPPACQVIKSSVVVAFLQQENEMGFSFSFSQLCAIPLETQTNGMSLLPS